MVAQKLSIPFVCASPSADARACWVGKGARLRRRDGRSPSRRPEDRRRSGGDADHAAAHRVEDDFKPGDALLFNKMVIHLSVMPGEGPLPRRAAYVMRFVDAGSHYDLERARNLEFPVERYGQGLFPYKPFSRQHIEIAEAGAGDPLVECTYFDNRDRRTLRRGQDR
jgi:hypothetical protein